MKIMLVVSSMGSGGAERVAASLVNAWAQRGDTVTLVITYSGRGACFYPLAPNVRCVFLADRVKAGARMLQYPARFRALRALIRESAPDVVVSFLSNVNITTILATRGLGIPVIASEHIDPSADGRSQLMSQMCRFVYPSADLLTLLTDNMEASFRKMVPRVKRIEVVPNPLPDELLLLQPETIEKSARKRLVAVGRLNTQKQFDLLIDVFATLAPEFPDWDLWIWGEGPERAVLEAQVAQLKMNERVLMPGKTTTPWEEMARSDAFVLSSRYEGLPMAMLEGMALGLATVAFDCKSGPRELTRDGQDGLLVPAGDKAALIDALRRVMSDEALRAELGRKAAASVRQRYSSPAILRQWDAIFAQLGARSRGGEGKSTAYARAVTGEKA
ncbi:MULTISPECIES: glycosyltransferase family 4 protein [Caballeronia]|jgi:glycosyltransferase involved in cell wall biosynthesis|uniref:glycosyltransferase family 4 protein n=1 Tax=Caballeronia TaxID=1827195 RepID=UPI00025BC75F|nr:MULTISPECIES: glycosyltransferase family 4 protein [Caballeronia]EKS70705.1 glycosyl transferase family protein [Burkholderia sp. SJ98]MCG7403512.1 glycosyltransferase family 4 protein [Caballeronia zhejiangensis]MCI1045658.1 glycosyltransferase family 4 protein [Caballeronia zhejiangensis]MDR5795366.1 glycosyltransferase family 4 protein [Caballeronia sp. LZ008]